MFDEQKVIECTESPFIQGLDISMFDYVDMLNVILQRSEVLFDEENGKRPIRAWSKGNEAPLMRIVAKRGDTMVRRAIAVLYLEFLSMKSLLDARSWAHIADIGCGYGFMDLFFARDYGSKITLIDIETNDRRHFGFRSEGAAYASLDVAKAFLLANGVGCGQVATVNPNKVDVNSIAKVDLAISFLSCGFHYPVETYQSLWENSVRKSGAMILDLRSDPKQEQLSTLSEIGKVSKMWGGEKWDRVFVDKAA